MHCIFPNLHPQKMFVEISYLTSFLKKCVSSILGFWAITRVFKARKITYTLFFVRQKSSLVCIFFFSILLRVISVPSISETRLINILKTYFKGFPASVKCNSSNVIIVAVQFTKVHHRGSTTHQISPLEKCYFKSSMLWPTSTKTNPAKN